MEQVLITEYIQLMRVSLPDSHGIILLCCFALIFASGTGMCRTL